MYAMPNSKSETTRDYISQWLCIDIRNQIHYSSANSDIPDFTYCNQNSGVAVVASSTNIYCSTDIHDLLIHDWLVVLYRQTPAL